MLILRDARQISNAEAGLFTALLLYRSAIRLLARATLMREGVQESDTWAKIRLEIQNRSVRYPIDSLDALGDSSLMDGGEQELASLGPAAGEAALARLQRLGEALSAPLERDATRAAQLSRARWFRIGAALTLVALTAYVVWVRVSSPKDLALHKTVTVTDRDDYYGVEPSALVNGERTDLGFHTKGHSNSMVTIDLEKPQHFSTIDVYNRADCCAERAVPLVLQVSSDGQHFQTVARKEDVFDRWHVQLAPGPEYRYIRLLHPRAEYFHLSEVEVYR